MYETLLFMVVLQTNKMIEICKSSTLLILIIEVHVCIFITHDMNCVVWNVKLKLR